MTKRSSHIYCRCSLAAIALFLISQFAMAQENKTTTLLLDHVSICGANLDALRQTFRDAGMAADLLGPQANGATQTAIVGFDDGTYIELVAPVNPGAAGGSAWAKFMTDDDVPCAWTVGTNSLQEDVDRLKQAGIAVTAPARGDRKRADGMSLEWTTADVGSTAPGAVLPSIIEDQTPRAWRAPASASVQGAPVAGVGNVVIGVNNLEAAIALFHKAYGWSDPLIENQRDFGKIAYFPGEPVILAAPTGGGWLADRIAKYGESPVAYLLNARDFAAAVKKYKLSGGKTWFGQKVAWFDLGKLKGYRLGVIGQ